MPGFTRTLILSLFCIILVGCGNGSASTGEFPTLTPGQLVVALYPGFAPVVFHDPLSGEISGIDVDILRSFADEYGLDLNIQVQNFSGIWELPAKGMVDIAGSGISRLDSRLVSGMVWSEPYYEVRRSLSIRAEDRSKLQSIADFGGLAIGFTPGSTGEFDTRQRAPATTRLIPYQDEVEAIEDLLSGEIAAIARGDVSSLYDSKMNPQLGVTDIHFYNPSEYFVFALPAGNTELLAALNKFLVDIGNSGDIERIVNKYLNSE